MAYLDKFLTFHGFLHSIFCITQHITTKLVKECLADIVKVIVDYGSAPKK